jgi:predicted PurR-regulated permease PerM
MRAWIRFAGSILVVAVLYLAQAILVPLALATLLTFLLTPVVVFLQRRLGRVPSVMVVILLVSALLGGIGWGIAGQLRGLAHELPHYRDNIRQRILDVRVSNRGSAVEKVQETVKDIQDAIEGQPAPSPRRAPPAAPAPTADKSPELWSYPRAFGSLLDGLVTAGLVAILAIFMLLERQELRNRLIRLTGFGRVGRTTKALDEASSRISRYLLVQSLINGTYGLGVSLGLYLLGVPHALLWGFLGALLRFVPYVGPWIAALAPIALSLGVFPGWVRPLLVVALMIALELFTNLVLETFLYAGAAGVSALGLLVAVTFWTWLWGAPGLLMAIPLTVCLVVFSRHVPGLQFLATLLGDEPALTPDVGYYQRLLAGDRDEAADIVEEHLARGGADTVYDAVILPALNYGRRDADDLSAAQLEDVVRGTLAIVDDVTSPPALEAAERSPGAAANPTRVLGYPAMGEADEAALLMLRQLLDATRFAVDVGSSKLLSSEVVAMVRAQAYPAVCVVALPPGGLPHARYLCKKLRVAFPDLRILVGRWGPPGLGGEGGETLLAAGADAVGTTLLESRDQLYQLAPLLAPART